jgi:hypothetical protein
MANELSVLYPSMTPTSAPVESGAANAMYPSASVKPATNPAKSLISYPSAVRKSEPAPASTTDYGAVMPFPKGANAANSPEFELAKRAMVKAGVPITAARAFYLMALHAHEHGPYDVSDEQALEELRALWGDQTDAKIALAHGLAREVAKTWPGFADYLNRTRMGSLPSFVRLMVQHAETLAEKR